MSYLEEIKRVIHHRDYQKFLVLWEEYTSADQVDAEEFLAILNALLASDFSEKFGKIADSAIPLWRTIENENDSYNVLKVLIDLQSINSEEFKELALEALRKKYPDEKQAAERLRIVGLRGGESFQKALSNYDLLVHLKKGNFVYHHAGWGTGEIIDASPLRETVSIEFENVSGIKHLTFANSFKTLAPLPSDHFLSQRFSNPDAFEALAKDDPAKVVKLLLRDLGAKTSSEIKDEISHLVIPEKEYNKWWQLAKGRLKKDTFVQTPDTPSQPFCLRKSEVSHVDEYFTAIQKAKNPSTLIQTAYTFLRDFPALIKEEKVAEKLKQELTALLDQNLPANLKLQILIFLDTFFSFQPETLTLSSYLPTIEDLDKVIRELDIISFRKQALITVKKSLENWQELFLKLLPVIEPNLIKEYLLEELCHESAHVELENQIQQLMMVPEKNPEFFVWYFQKIVKEKNEELPFSTKEGVNDFFEHLLILLNKIELQPQWRELTKKIVHLITNQRYKLTRELIQSASVDFLKEFLLLISKCHSISDNDKNNFRALVSVVEPSLGKKEENDSFNTIWTTEEGYTKTRNRMEQIGHVEMIEVAKEIEKARAYGDLRENSEYKFACERRHRLQLELKSLSKLLNQARIIRKEDVAEDMVGIGSIVELEKLGQGKVTYTILGPWDTDANNNIISLQSKLAQAMIGHKKGDQFTFRDENFKVLEIKSFLE